MKTGWSRQSAKQHLACVKMAELLDVDEVSVLKDENDLLILIRVGAEWIGTRLSQAVLEDREFSVYSTIEQTIVEMKKRASVRSMILPYEQPWIWDGIG